MVKCKKCGTYYKVSCHVCYPDPPTVETEDILALIYSRSDIHGRTVIATLCDEIFDRSGALLGRIRELSQEVIE